MRVRVGKIVRKARRKKRRRIYNKDKGKEYRIFLKSEEWKTFRNNLFDKRFALKKPKCERCGKEITISSCNAHHKRYNNLLSERNIIFLCKDCHNNKHERKIKRSDKNKNKYTKGNNTIFKNGNKYRKIASKNKINKETEKAILVDNTWYPKSQVIYKYGYIYVSYWILKKRELK